MLPSFNFFFYDYTLSGVCDTFVYYKIWKFNTIYYIDDEIKYLFLHGKIDGLPMWRHRNLYKCHNTLLMVIGRFVENVLEVDFETWAICYWRVSVDEDRGRSFLRRNKEIVKLIRSLEYIHLSTS